MTHNHMLARATGEFIYIKPAIKKKPDEVVIHIGTNDTNHRKAPQIIEGINRLYQQIKVSSPKTNITISELIIRDDNSTAKSKVLEVNIKLLKDYCSKNSSISMLCHPNINVGFLNRSRLHLNKAGTSVFARNLINHLKHF